MEIKKKYMINKVRISSKEKICKKITLKRKKI